VSEERRGQNVGDYVLERKLGRGGMSVVWFARARSTGRPAAVKILAANLPKNIDADRRLTQEARSIQRIDHPHVVKVYAWGRTPDFRPYIAMEYLEGHSFGAVSGKGKVLPLEQLTRIMLQMLAALDKAHALDIIHRDLKPDNVLLVKRDGDAHYVKVLDFGIAKLLGAQPHSAVETARGVVLGTPEYLPPEIPLDQAVSPATDLYAIGVMLFEATTGRLPFVARGAMALAEAHCFSPPPRPRTYAPDLPVAFERIILKCMEKRPSDRYQSAEALAEALRPWAGVAETMHTQITPIPTPVPPTQLHAIEQTIRGEIQRRWARQTLPITLAQSLTTLDAARGAVDALHAELELIEVVQATQIVEQPTQRASQAEADARSVLKALCAQDQQLSEQLDSLNDALGTRLSSLLDVKSTLSLQAILTGDTIGLLAERLARVAEISNVERTRAKVLAQVEIATDTLAQRITERAQLESDALIAVAVSEATHLRQQVHAHTLQTRREAHHREWGEALAQCALDLALSAGLTKG
jgi:serine/threonine protein kinase